MYTRVYKRRYAVALPVGLGAGSGCRYLAGNENAQSLCAAEGGQALRRGSACF